MKVDRRREVRGVAETARFAFDAHDLAVEPFGHAVGDRVLDEPEHPVEVSLERGRDGLDGIELRADGPAIPPGKKPPHRRGLAVGPECPQGLFDRPGASDFQIQGLQCREGVCVPFGTALIAEQPHVLGAGERRVLAVAKKRAMFLLAHGVDGLRHVPHDVKSVEHNLGVALRHALAGCPDVRLPHIHRHGVQRGLLDLGQLRIVRRQTRGGPLLDHKFHGRALQVTD